MRRFSVASALLIAIACAQQNEYTFEPDEEGGSSSGGKTSSAGKGGSVSSTGGKTSSAGTTGSGGKTTAGTGSGDEGGAAEDGGESSSGGSGGSGGTATAGSAGKASGGSAGNGGSAGSGCTPTSAGPIAGLSARYESEIDGNGTGVGAQLVIFNEGPSTLNLADLELRYYLTIDGEVQATINSNVNWAFIRPNGGGSETPIKDLVTFGVVPLTCKGNGADTYFQFTFAANAGNIAPGFHLRLSFTANNGSNQTFDQSNDYSFNKDQPSNTDYAKVVVIQNNGNRAWGTEP